MKETIVVAGTLARKPGRGGHAWVMLQYLLGLRRLGYEVLFVDQIDAQCCRDRQGRPCSVGESENLRYLRSVMAEFGLLESYTLIGGEGRSLAGVSLPEALSRTRRSLLLLNFMGFLRHPGILEAARRLVFFDIDPGFGQIWRQLGLADVFAGHERFVTIGERIGEANCPIPTCGFDWLKTPQPVVLERWPACRRPASQISCVATWRGAFAPLEYAGKRYGLRAHEFRRFFSLPRRCPVPFVLALDIDEADRPDLEALNDNGWLLASPLKVANTPGDYQRFIQGSMAEFGVAKNLYVETRCGWLSDRTLCYLASGRPAVVQDTGLEGLYPSGRGLLLFRDLEGAVSAVEELRDNYAAHARAARELAVERFDSDKVLGRLLTRLDAR